MYFVFKWANLHCISQYIDIWLAYGQLASPLLRQRTRVNEPPSERFIWISMASSLFSPNQDNSTNSKKAKRILCGRFSRISTKLPRIPLRRQKLPKVVGKPLNSFSCPTAVLPEAALLLCNLFLLRLCNTVWWSCSSEPGFGWKLTDAMTALWRCQWKWEAKLGCLQVVAAKTLGQMSGNQSEHPSQSGCVDGEYG